MKATSRIFQLNKTLERTYGKDTYWVSNHPYDRRTLILHLYKNSEAQPKKAAAFIFKTDTFCKKILSNSDSTLYLRENINISFELLPNIGNFAKNSI